MVCVTCLLIEQLVPERHPKKLKGLILHIMDSYFHQWFYEAALQLKIQGYQQLLFVS